MSKACVFLANGLEECEGLVTIDILRRAGVEVTTASIHEDKLISSSHNISFYADALANGLDMAQFDMVVLPGGLGGTNNLAASALVAETVKAFAADETKLVAAVCAAPSVLGMLGLLQGKKATCYPGFENHFCGGQYTGDYVTVCENIITGKGAGAAMLFGAAIADYFTNGKGTEVLSEMQHIMQ